MQRENPAVRAMPLPPMMTPHHNGLRRNERERSPFAWNTWYHPADLTASLALDVRWQRRAAPCPAMKPGSGRILLCVKKHFPALSDRCKDAIGRVAERRIGA